MIFWCKFSLPVNQYFVPPTSHSVLSVYLGSFSHKFHSVYPSMHAVFHFLTQCPHQAPPATQTCAHWQPYSAIQSLCQFISCQLPSYPSIICTISISYSPGNKITVLFQTNISPKVNAPAITCSVFRLILSQIHHSVYPSMHAVSHSHSDLCSLVTI